MKKNSNHKTAIISGGFGGIGWAIFERLADDGYRVAILGNKISADKISLFRDTGHLFLECDITQTQDVKQALNHVTTEYGQIWASIHCAVSPILRKRFLDTTPEEFRQQFEVGVFGGFNFLQESAKIMKLSSQGRIVAITSAGVEPNSASGSMPGYISAKYSLRGLLREMAKELTRFQITVNAVAPGFINTSLNHDIPEKIQEFIKEKNPFKKMVQAQDVAATVAFLCSTEAQALTGLHIPVTYGEVMTL